MKKTSFRKILFRNTLALAFPMLVLLGVLMVLILKFPVIQNTQDTQIEATDNLATQLEEIYGTGRTNVLYEAYKLNYTGVNYLEDGKLVGAYYYNIDDDGLNFFLIETDSPEQFIDSISLRGKVVKNEIMVNYIMDRFEESTDVNSDMVAGFASSYMISVPDYPYRFIMLIYVVIFIPIIAGTLIVAYTLLIWMMPQIHPQTRQLVEYGDVRTVIKELDDELKNKLIFRHGNIYVTDNYLVVSYTVKTDVIKLDLVKYMSKNIVEDYKGFNRSDDVYRITFSNPEKLFYEIDLVGEELADTIVDCVLNGSYEE
jgi:phage shock protein PspC (stress-responsive transcriptional regulator)